MASNSFEGDGIYFNSCEAAFESFWPRIVSAHLLPPKAGGCPNLL